MKTRWMTVLVLLGAISIILIAKNYKTIQLGINDKSMHPDFINSITSERKSSSRINSLEFNPEVLHLSVGFENGDIKIYDASDINNKITISAHEYRVSHLASPGNENILASSSYLEPTTKIWNQQTGDLLLEIPNTNGPELFSNDGNSIFMANSSDLVIYDLTNRKMDIAEYRTNGVIRSISISSDGKYLAVGTTGKIQIWSIIYTNNDVSLWNRVLGKKKVHLELISERTLYGLKDWIECIGFSKDNQHLVSISRHGGVNVHTVPELGSESQYKSQLKHIYSAQYYPSENLIISTGTKVPSGLGEGFVATHKLDMGTEKVITNNLSNMPVSVLIPETKNVVIADRGKFRVLDLNSSESANKLKRSSASEIKVNIPKRSYSTEAKLHVVGVYEGVDEKNGDKPWWANCVTDPANPPGTQEMSKCHDKYARLHPEHKVKVRVSANSNPVILALMAYEPIQWVVEKDDGVKIEAVILAGYHGQRISGIGSAVPVDVYTYEHSDCNTCQVGNGYFYAYKRQDKNFTRAMQRLKTITNHTPASFQGRYRGKAFTVIDSY